MFSDGRERVYWEQMGWQIPNRSENLSNMLTEFPRSGKHTSPGSDTGIGAMDNSFAFK